MVSKTLRVSTFTSVRFSPPPPQNVTWLPFTFVCFVSRVNVCLATAVRGMYNTCSSGRVLTILLCWRPRLPDRRVLVAVSMLQLIRRRAFRGRRALGVNRMMLMFSANQTSARPRTWLVSVVLIGRQTAWHSDVTVTSARSPNNKKGQRYYAIISLPPPFHNRVEFVHHGPRLEKT